MAIVSSTLGSPTKTGWKRRSRAASFSMCLRYSSSVVAPMQRSSPRARAGLSRLAASLRPFGRAGADDGVQLVDEQDHVAAGVLHFAEHGLEPLFELAAVLGAGDRARPCRGRSRACSSGSAARRPATIRRASPSTMAVLPTPGSPISTGLFFVRRERTWITRRISWSRPMTGSSLPWLARSTRSMPYFCRAWNLSSGFWSVTRALPRTVCRALRMSFSPMALSLSRFLALRVDLGQGQQQVLGRDELVLHRRRLRAGPLRRPASALATGCGGAPPETLGKWFSSPSTVRSSCARLTPILSSTGRTTPSLFGQQRRPAGAADRSADCPGRPPGPGRAGRLPGL